MTKKSIYLYAAAALLLILFGYSYFSDSKDTPAVMAAAAKKSSGDQQDKMYPQAPDFVLKDLDGKDVRLSDQKGKVVLIDFWATWCPPCRKGIPELVEMQKEYGAEKLTVLGINLDQDDAAKVKEFARNYKINYPVLFYTPEMVDAYGGIEAIPTTFVLDKQGKVRQWVQGYRPKEYFTKLVDSLL